MKIAIIRQRYTPFGGAERFITRALGTLVAQGATVDVIARAWLTDKNGTFGFISCDPKAYGRFGRDRSFARQAAHIVRNKKYDIVQSHERIPGMDIYRAGDGVHAAWLSHLARIRGALGRISTRFDPYHRYVLGSEAAMYAHPNLKAVICNSEMVRQEILAHYPVDEGKLHLIRNGIDLDEFSPKACSADRDETRRLIGVSPDTTLLLHVGNGFERKGLAQSVSALARLANKNIHLAIVGTDKKANRVRRLAERHKLSAQVHFIGPQLDVRRWYGAADAFVMPTLYDPLPNACLEALACGLPVLTSTTCGAAELLTGQKNGIVVDALDIDGIAAGFSFLADNANAMRPAAREAVLGLDLDAMGQRLLALYDAIRNR